MPSLKRLKTRVAPTNGRLPLMAWDGYALAQRSTRLLGSLVERRLRVSPARAPEELTEASLRRHLEHDLLPFWAEHAVDSTHGGFLVDLDGTGRPRSGEKTAALQARVVYAFAIGEEILPGRGYGELAQQGVQFLVRHMWDERFGGWFGRVTRDGRVVSDKKSGFDQTYVVAGLLRFYQATGDTTARSYALDTLELFDRHLWDHNSGGYWKACDRSWGNVVLIKDACTHIEAFNALCLAVSVTHDPELSHRTESLAQLLVSKMRLAGRGPILENFTADWTYEPFRTRDVVWIGHNLKAASQLADWGALTANRQLIDHAIDLAAHAIRRGWDDAHGGFFRYVFRSGLLADSEKLWWPQAEGLRTILKMHAHTKEEKYLELARRLWAFCSAYLIDPNFGEWHFSCFRAGGVKDARKGAWDKGPYHTVRACYEAATLLSCNPDRQARSFPSS
jgi:mannose/cellobiose epimerase-like protein (N-acyl-D-glucosamine 2-epimerase family)